MFASMVKNKIAKSKIVIDSGYNSQINQAPRRTESIQPLKKTESQIINSQPPTQNVSQVNKPKPLNINEIQLKTLIYSVKRYDKTDKNQLIFRMKEDGSMDVDVSEESGKLRIQIKKADLEKNKLQFRKEENCIVLKTKRATQKREDPKSRTFVNQKILKQETISLYPKVKEMISQLKNILSPENPSSEKSGQPSLQTPGEQPLDDYDIIKFALPSTSRLVETEKLRRNIKDMKEQDKNLILMDIYKIKKQYQDSSEVNRKFKCPVHSCQKCQKPYRDAQQLKTHLRTKHPELAKHGIQLIQYDGSFEYSNKALDLAIFLGKEYPSEMKKVIKKMKTKMPAE